jgi:hypothetical protein
MSNRSNLTDFVCGQLQLAVLLRNNITVSNVSKEYAFFIVKNNRKHKICLGNEHPALCNTFLETSSCITAISPRFLIYTYPNLNLTSYTHYHYFAISQELLALSVGNCFKLPMSMSVDDSSCRFVWRSCLLWATIRGKLDANKQYLIGCNTVQSGGCSPTFRRNILSPSSWWESKPSKYNILPTTCTLV